MSNQNPIIPPDKQLVRKWIEDWAGGQMKGPVTEDQLVVATQAAQWGADQELEACLDWLEQNDGRWEIRVSLRDARRPKPPTLKEQALAALNVIEDKMLGPTTEEKLIRKALEAL